MTSPARAVVDLGAIRSNVSALNDHAGSAAVLAVVKADGYGHGLVPAAKAALEGGASWLGTAQLDEALELRAAGIKAPVLSWLYAPGADFEAAVRAGIDLSVGAPWMLADILTAARQVGLAARVHLKVDTGLGRNGLMPQTLAEMLATLRAGKAEGLCQVVGVWSHLAWADDPGHPTVQRQHEAFADAVQVVERAGFDLQVRHLSNSAATLTDPSIRYDLVRPGLAVYGLSPVPQVGDSGHFGLRPAMRLEADLALTKTVDAGTGVSYGHEYTTPVRTVLGLVPIGYADGVPRHASGSPRALGAPVQVGARRLGIAGRVCMDQFMLDLGPDASEVAGETVVLFGSGESGEPTAQDWADAVGTISYEIVTRIGAQVPRVYVGGS